MPLPPGKKRRRKYPVNAGLASPTSPQSPGSGRSFHIWYPLHLWGVLVFLISLCLVLTYHLSQGVRSLRGIPGPGVESLGPRSLQLAGPAVASFPGRHGIPMGGQLSAPAPLGPLAVPATKTAPQSPGVPTAGEPKVRPPLVPESPPLVASTATGAPAPAARALWGSAPLPAQPAASEAATMDALVAGTRVPAAATAAPPAAAATAAREAAAGGTTVPPTGAAGLARSCTLEFGYANSQIDRGLDQFNVATSEACRSSCLASASCNCWSWKQDGFCRTGLANTCGYVGSSDDDNWKFGHCSDAVDAGVSSTRALATWPPVAARGEPVKWSEAYGKHFKHSVGRNIHAFYYMWYGSMEVDQNWVHWNHQLIPHPDQNLAGRWPAGKHDPDKGDIASTFWPQLGPYSSRDPAVIRAHMAQMQEASIGVAVVSWYPSGLHDDSGQWDSAQLMPLLLNEAARHGVEVAVHIEPYSGRTAQTVRRDIRLILDMYGNHPALHRRLACGAHRQLLQEPHKSRALPVIYVYDSYRIPVAEWGSLLGSGPLSIRNTELDAVVLCLWVEKQHGVYLSEGGFDGAYTYFAADGFSWASNTKNWPAMAAIAESHGAFLVPSVGPGYDDLKVRPWNGGTLRPREQGQYYDRMFQAAVGLSPSIVSLTSWNEWHEGTNLEPAVPKAGPPRYEDYGDEGPGAYLARTRSNVELLARKQVQIPVLIITHARAEYLRKALRAALQYRPHPEIFPLIASQDGTDQGVANVIREHMQRGDVAQHLTFKAPLSLKTGYKRLCAHYRWALDELFEAGGFQQAIILEEDIEVSPDFYSFFIAAMPLLKADPELFCISAWNDNGRPEVASDSQALFRTDFFPGLGWMLLRSFWLEIRGRWPAAYWDEYVRRGDVRKGRHCIRPEVSRTHTFGEVGVSAGQFYKTHLARNRLNTELVDWASEDLQHISTAGRFDEYLSRQVHEAELVSIDWLQAHRPNDRRKLAVLYQDSQWQRYASFFGLMDDAKEGIRRGTYRGVLPFTWQTCRIFLVRDWPLK